VTSRGHVCAEFKRALDRGNVWVAEAVARDLPQVSLDDALRLVHLYGEKESPKYERAALRWLERYLTESSPSLQDVANHRLGYVRAWGGRRPCTRARRVRPPAGLPAGRARAHH
jgi:hypothetical protein